MKRLLIIASLLLAAITESKAQNIRLGERVPDIHVETELGKELELGTKEYVCLIFAHSESGPSVAAFEKLNEVRDILLRNFDVVVITPEASDSKDAIHERLDLGGMVLAHDIEYRTFKEFGISYVPFCVIYERKRQKTVWFGSIQQLDAKNIELITVRS